jgi:hypothetical protein
MGSPMKSRSGISLYSFRNGRYSLTNQASPSLRPAYVRRISPLGARRSKRYIPRCG